MGKLNQVADGVWVRQSEWVWTNSIAVRGADGLILIDPGIDGSELNQLADDVDRLGIPVVAGFSTHPHWDLLLWHPRFGDVPRYATPGAAQAASEARERAQKMAAQSAPGIPLELIALVTPLIRPGVGELDVGRDVVDAADLNRLIEIGQQQAAQLPGACPDPMARHDRGRCLAEGAGLHVMGEVGHLAVRHLDVDRDGRAAELGMRGRGGVRVGQPPPARLEQARTGAERVHHPDADYERHEDEDAHAELLAQVASLVVHLLTSLRRPGMPARRAPRTS